MKLSAGEQAALDAARERDASLRASPERRRRDGIVHTPPELARFVARAADQLLRDELRIERGLADARVHVVDPACGPGAFLAAALQVAGVHGSLRSRLTGIDRDQHALESAARALAAASGTQLELRFPDTLRDEHLSIELSSAARVLVVVGNPPWSVSAAESSPQMQQLLEDFRRDVDGVRLPERKLGVLSATYVRFFRWPAELARGARAGAVVALVTNASFLDGPVQRGMRAALLRWFDAVHVIDLGGNALVGRPRGSSAKDDNVFGVRTGVAVTLLLRKPGLAEPRTAQLSYARLVGAREHKLEMLADATHRDLQPTPLQAASPYFRFLPSHVRDPSYERFVSLADCMPFHREGVQSNRDAIVVAADRETLLSRLRAFVADDVNSQDPALAQAYDSLAHYDPALASTQVQRVLELDPDGTRNVSARRFAYRPFDERWFCPVTPLCHRPRPALLAAFDQQALALVAVRKDRGSTPYAHFAATLLPPDNCFLSTRSSCRTRAFPVCAPDGTDNLSPRIRELFAARVGIDIDARAFLHYALCVLAAPSYRVRYQSQLRIDYPRIPLPSSREQWNACVRSGEQLARVFVAPLQRASVHGESLPHAARFSQLQIDEAGGCIRLGDKPLIVCASEVLGLRVGHHELLRSFIVARKHAAFDAGAYTELRAWVERGEQLVTAILRCEHSMAGG